MMQKDQSINVLGGPLSPCSMAPLTGFFRDAGLVDVTSEMGTFYRACTNEEYDGCGVAMYACVSSARSTVAVWSGTKSSISSRAIMPFCSSSLSSVSQRLRVTASS